MSSSDTPQETGAGQALRGVHFGVFLVSAATLLLEINLTRIFSYTIWYHFAFIVIAVALLGFGASGSVLTVWRGLSAIPPRKVLAWAAAASALGVAVILFVITQVPFNPFQILTDPSEIGPGLVYLFVVAIPFFFAGMTTAVALRSYPQRAGSLYFANLLGSGLGCLAFVWLMDWFGAAHLSGICAALYGTGALCFSERRTARLGLALVLAVGLTEFTAVSFTFTPCASKLAAKFEAEHSGEIIHSKWSAVFRTDVYDFPSPDIMRGKSYGSFGMGSGFDGVRPSLRFIAHDGDACAVMMNCEGAPEDMELFRHHLLGVPYQLRPGGRVFIGGVGGGIDVLAALANGAGEIDGIELDPNTVEVIRDLYPDYVGNLCSKANVDIRAGDARGMLNRSKKQYDVVQYNGVDTIASAAAGAHLLNESYLYTIEAFGEYFDHLAPNGLLSMSAVDFGGQSEMPRMLPRFCSVVASALERRGVSNPAACCVTIATGMSDTLLLGTVLAKTQPFSKAELDQVRAYAEREGFAFWHLPDEEIETVSSTILRLDPASRASYFADQYLDFSAPTDDKPFFMHFYKWRSLWSHFSLKHRYMGATGNIVLLGGLAFSVLASLCFIVIPAYWHARRQTARPQSSKADIVYFCAIGLGFMFLEIGLIQQLVLFLGYPTYSLTVTLFSVLTFAGVGSYLSRKVRLHSAKPIWLLFGLLAAVTVLYLLFGATALRSLMHLPLPLRVGIAITAILPVGLLLGTFFPLGIRDLGGRNSDAVPLAWAANGSCSVIGIMLAVILATAVGFRNVFVLALLLYLVAATMFHTTRKLAK